MTSALWPPDTDNPVEWLTRVILRLRAHRESVHAQFDALIKTTANPPADNQPATLVQYLKACSSIIEKQLIVEARRFSKSEWLWRLRRLPDEVYEDGAQVRGGLFERSLAEIVSQFGGTDASSIAPIDGTYECNEDLFSECLRFVAAIQYFATVLWLLRSTSRGFEIAFYPGDSLPRDNRTPEQREAERIFMNRIYNTGSRFMSRSGTDLYRKGRNCDDAGTVLVIRRTNVEIKEIESDEDGVLYKDTIARCYVPTLVDLSRVAAFSLRLNKVGFQWPNADFGIVTLALRLSSRLWIRKRTTWLCLLTYGYVSFEREFFLNTVRWQWPYLLEDMRVVR